MIKFLHAADIHLGLRFKNLQSRGFNSSQRRLELWDSLSSFIEYGIEKKVDFIFLVGDLYEDDYFTLGDIRKLRDMLGRAEDINIIISAGNHDSRHKNSLYNRVEWSDNVYIFGTDGIGFFDFEDKDTRIYGYSWSQLYIEDDRIFDTSNFSRKYKNNILTIHGDLYNDSSYLPLALDKLKNLDLDYIALGHIHKKDIIENKIAYPGSLEPLHFGERGRKGFIEGSLSQEEVKLDFIPFNKRSFFVEIVRIDDCMKEDDIIDLFEKIDRKSREKDFYRFILTGYMDRYINKVDMFQTLKERFYYVEILDRTSPNFDIDFLEEEHRDDIIGNFIKEMKDRDLEKVLNRDILYYGLEVLLKE